MLLAHAPTHRIVVIAREHAVALAVCVGLDSFAGQQAVFAVIGQAHLLAFLGACGVVDLHHVAPGVVPITCMRAAVQAVAGGCAFQWAVAGVVRVDAVACGVVVPVLFALHAFTTIAIHAVHAFKLQAVLGVVGVALAAVGLALGWLPRLGRGVQAQVLDVVELADAVVVVVAAEFLQNDLGRKFQIDLIYPILFK